MKEPYGNRIRVAAAQYYVRHISAFEQFVDQVSAVVETAADYRCRLLVLSEYFTLQLMALGDIKRPIEAQVRDVAAYVPRFVELMEGLARDNGLYIVAGTIPVLDEGSDRVYNDSFVFSPNGGYATQGKMHMTRFEREDWHIHPRSVPRIFETDFGKIAVAICYDVEFPELIRAMALEGAHILCVPSNTDDRHGFLRVRYCAHARTIENQMYVINSVTVGGLPRTPDFSLNYGQASILTPNDYTFSRDGIMAEGTLNHDDIIIGELDVKTAEDSRSFGTELPLNDSKHTRELIAHIETQTI
ncbi:MAG: carbon-nitrogen hydrolase family protein [Bacteroidota bacterium]